MEYTITTPEFTFKFSEELKDNFYIKDTLIDKLFFNNNFNKINNLNLLYSKETVDFLIPLIRSGKLFIPPSKIISELSELLDFISGDNLYFKKCSQLLSTGHIMDFIGLDYNLNLLSGKYFEQDNISYFDIYNETESNKLKQKICEGYKISYNEYQNIRFFKNFLKMIPHCIVSKYSDISSLVFIIYDNETPRDTFELNIKRFVSENHFSKCNNIITYLKYN